MQGLGSLHRLRLVTAPDPHLDAVEIEIDDRGGVEREDLAERETADHRIAERLAHLRAGAVAERQRHAREHRRRGRHQDRAEAQQAGFADRGDRRQAAVALRRDGEVDQHDAVLLDDADQENDADDTDHRQVHVTEIERQQRADTGRRQGRQNGERMDEALVEDAENDVDHDQRGRDQGRLARQRRLERLGIALERPDDPGGQVDLARGLADRIDRLAERHARAQVEAQGDGGKLPLVRDRQRADVAGIDIDQRR